MQNKFLVIGGTPKSGTTALHKSLQADPSFYLPSKKESHYFAYPELAKYTNGPGDSEILKGAIKSSQKYQDQFKKATPNQVCVDISPSYLFHNRSANRMKDEIGGNVKVVFILRNPIEKMASQFQHLSLAGFEKFPFCKAINAENDRRIAGYSDMWLYTQSGFYARKLLYFYKHLGQENIKIFTYNEFKTDPLSVVQDIYSFVGLQYSPIQFKFKQLNNSALPRSPLVADATALVSQIDTHDLPYLELIKKLSVNKLKSINRGKRFVFSAYYQNYFLESFRNDIVQLEKLLDQPTGWLV